MAVIQFLDQAALLHFLANGSMRQVSSIAF